MTSFSALLSHLDDIDVAAAERARDALLSDLDTPEGWTVADSDVEMSQDETGDWFLVAFEAGDDPDKRALVFLLGNAYVQIYVEGPGVDDWGEPTRDITDIETALRGYAC